MIMRCPKCDHEFMRDTLNTHCPMCSCKLEVLFVTLTREQAEEIAKLIQELHDKYPNSMRDKDTQNAFDLLTPKGE